MQHIENIARQLYDAHGVVTGYKSYEGAAMPHWEELPSNVQAAWTAAAEKAWELLSTEVVAPS